MSNHVASINVCLSGSTYYRDINNFIKHENFVIIPINFVAMQRIFWTTKQISGSAYLIFTIFLDIIGYSDFGIFSKFAIFNIRFCQTGSKLTKGLFGGTESYFNLILSSIDKGALLIYKSTSDSFCRCILVKQGN